ncbi:3-oxoacyl-ACP synthase III family protein [Microscilla marina]|uniref:3-oxoacyl-acyl-carrier-protein synthase III n=1 Tax=Microscilla marina ATCC 23134 TaxID=313606 RepID=A1ZRZ1_MICM2|nr:ketoacyl-ACP synthase III [Microscilla marina]EAY26879.1 3-oxoacyl-acyl-carrier-protein synthase III [Microscilla marina ATCC 23134]
MYTNSVITGTGAYLPKTEVPGSYFHQNTFYRKNGEPIEKPSEAVADKVEEISGIRERRYIEEHHHTAHMAALAAQNAIVSAGIDKEQLDTIIVAHNFGNLVDQSQGSHLIPNLAALVKHHLQIKNQRCAAFDLLFGCPGWVQAVIQAHQSIACGDAQHVLVIGAEAMSRVLDPHDPDSMLFGDGAGAVVVSGFQEEQPRGVLANKTFSHCEEEVNYLKMGASTNPDLDKGLYVKMQGKKVYRYAVENMPELIHECLEKADVPLENISKFLLHQANEKMLKAIFEKTLNGAEDAASRFCKQVPVILQNIGNSSVATIPTLLDVMLKGKLPEHTVDKNDVVVMASVGAGMHTNCLVYRF